MHGEVRVDADTDLLHDAPIFRKPVDQPEFPEAVGDENTVTEGFGQIRQGFSGTRVADVSGGDAVCACEQDFIFGGCVRTDVAGCDVADKRRVRVCFQGVEYGKLREGGFEFLYIAADAGCIVNICGGVHA